VADKDQKSDILMVIDGYNPRTVEGESTDDNYTGAIELRTFSFGGPTKGREKSSNRSTTDLSQVMDRKQKFENDEDGEDNKPDKIRTTIEFDVTKDMDYSSPVLLQAFCKNLTAESEPFKKVVIYCRLPGSPSPIVAVEVTFRNVYIVNFSMDVSGSDSVPTEKIKFVFDELELKYSPQKTSGDAAPPGIFGFNFKDKKQKKMM